MIIKIGYMYIKDYKKLGNRFLFTFDNIIFTSDIKKAKNFHKNDISIISAFSNLFCLSKDKFELIKKGSDENENE